MAAAGDPPSRSSSDQSRQTPAHRKPSRSTVIGDSNIIQSTVGDTIVSGNLSGISDSPLPSWLRAWRLRGVVGIVASVLLLAGGGLLLFDHATTTAKPKPAISDDERCAQIAAQQGIDPAAPGVTFECTMTHDPSFTPPVVNSKRSINRAVPLLLAAGLFSVIYGISLLTRFRRWRPVDERETWKPAVITHYSSRYKQVTLYQLTPEASHQRMVGLGTGGGMRRERRLSEASTGEAMPNGTGGWLVRIAGLDTPFTVFEARSDRERRNWDKR